MHDQTATRTDESADLSHEFVFAELDSHPEWTRSYWELGYVIIRTVFDGDEIEALRRRCDRWYAEGMRHPSTFRHRNKIIWIGHDERIGKHCFGMQWPSYEDETLDAVRTDARMLRILEPLIGRDLKQIINQLHWKTPGGRITWGFHRDRRSRTPAEAFRDLAGSYVQTGLAIDRHWAGNGAMKIAPGSHKIPHSELFKGSTDRSDTCEEAYRAAGFDVDRFIDVELEAGDLALWGPDTIHGGGLNTTADNYRRLYINGYVTAANCDRGEWVFRDGEPVPLDLQHQALIQYEPVNERLDAHYPHWNDPSAKRSD